MRGVYTIESRIPSVSAAKTLLYLEAPSNAVLEILSASVTNMNNDTSEQLEIGLYRVTNNSGVSGSGVNPYKHEPSDAATSAIAIADLGAEPASYNTGALDSKGWNNLGGYYFDPIPESRPIIPPTGAIGIRLITAADTAFKGSVTLTYREIG